MFQETWHYIPAPSVSALHRARDGRSADSVTTKANQRYGHARLYFNGMDDEQWANGAGKLALTSKEIIDHSV